jgi:hypothetical protein
MIYLKMAYMYPCIIKTRWDIVANKGSLIFSLIYKGNMMHQPKIKLISLVKCLDFSESIEVIELHVNLKSWDVRILMNSHIMLKL